MPCRMRPWHQTDATRSESCAVAGGTGSPSTRSRGIRDYNIKGIVELTLGAHTVGRPETTGHMPQSRAT